MCSGRAGKALPPECRAALRMCSMSITISTKTSFRLVECTELNDKADIDKLKALIEEHVNATGSQKGKRILADFESFLPLFKKIIPHDYKLITEEIAKGEQRDWMRNRQKLRLFISW